MKILDCEQFVIFARYASLAGRAGLDQYAGGEHVFRVFQAQSPGAAWEQRGEHLLECLGGIVERGFEYLWGYELDPYVEPDLINKSIMKARIPLRESMLLQAAGSIMKNAVQLVARKARSKVRHPMRYGLTPPTPEDRKGGGA